MIYMDVLTNGTNEEKEEYTFKLIAPKNKNSFDVNEFIAFLLSMVEVWGIITGTYQSKDLIILKKIKIFIEKCF